MFDSTHVSTNVKFPERIDINQKLAPTGEHLRLLNEMRREVVLEFVCQSTYLKEIKVYGWRNHAQLTIEYTAVACINDQKFEATVSINEYGLFNEPHKAAMLVINALSAKVALELVGNLVIRDFVNRESLSDQKVNCPSLPPPE